MDHIRWNNFHLILPVSLSTSINSEICLNPGKECRQNLATKHVAFSLDSHTVNRFVKLEAAVSVAPSPLIPVVEFNASTFLIVDHFGVFFAININGFLRDKLFISRELVV